VQYGVVQCAQGRVQRSHMNVLGVPVSLTFLHPRIFSQLTTLVTHVPAVFISLPKGHWHVACAVQIPSADLVGVPYMSR